VKQDERWRPQPRPGWVDRLNRMGRSVGGAERMVALDEASLLDAATVATGLHDFGDDDWREPFRILIADMEQESELTLTGRILARFELLRSLEARLGMAEAERQHPELLEQEIRAPILITGLGRTGTSILHELLAQDPAFRAPLGWEFRYPAPPPDAATRATDPRIEQAAADIEFYTDVIPEFLAMHETTPDGPDEDTSGMRHSFATLVWSSTHRAPNYDTWLRRSAPQVARFHKRLLQHLQFRTPGRWILKGPTHLSALPDLFANYPDLQIVQTHRDPLKVMASITDMVGTLRWQRSDRVDQDEYARSIAFGYPFLLDYVTGQREKGVVPDDRFVDVRFADLMEDHLGTIATVYEQLGMELTSPVAARMEAYLASRPRGRHGARAYSFELLGLDEAELRAKFAAYMERFAVPQESL
jgi:hypothetical protein